jgi:NADPH:quinone reductase-like Zn-dependent oxidoreductase
MRAAIQDISMTKNEAAWLVAAHKTLEVGPAPYTEPQGGEVLVRNHAVAINPVDWMMPIVGQRLFKWLRFPFIVGSDIAGEVVAIGSGVTEVKVGDRVLAFAAGMCQSRNRASEGAFQRYSIVLPRLTTNIPDTLSYEQACVVPLGLLTAACGLFQKDALGLELPTMDSQPRDQWVILAGGATSVGCNAIQLAKAAGYSVVTTSSPKNFSYMRSLGADLVFDYNSATLTRDIIAALQGKKVAGAMAIGSGSALTCMDALAETNSRKFVANISAPVPFASVKGNRISLPTFARLGIVMLRSTLAMRRRTRRHGVVQKFFDASSVVDNEVGPAIFRDYVVPALAAGRFQAAPPAQVVGNSLQDVQKAFDIQRKGVSATKIVVSLA